jgi:hypothetical protein
MNVLDSINESIELLQNRRKLSQKSAGSSEYNYGRVTAFNEALAVLEDIKSIAKKL